MTDARQRLRSERENRPLEAAVRERIVAVGDALEHRPLVAIAVGIGIGMLLAQLLGE